MKENGEVGQIISEFLENLFEGVFSVAGMLCSLTAPRRR